jgi:hypothetical protein
MSLPPVTNVFDTAASKYDQAKTFPGGAAYWAVKVPVMLVISNNPLPQPDYPPQGFLTFTPYHSESGDVSGRPVLEMIPASLDTGESEFKAQDLSGSSDLAFPQASVSISAPPLLPWTTEYQYTINLQVEGYNALSWTVTDGSSDVSVNPPGPTASSSVSILGGGLQPSSNTVPFGYAWTLILGNPAWYPPTGPRQPVG